MACVPCRADRRCDSADGSRFEATAPGPWGFKISDGLISVNEELHSFKQSIFGSIIQDIQRDIPNA